MLLIGIKSVDFLFSAIMVSPFSAASLVNSFVNLWLNTSKMAFFWVAFNCLWQTEIKLADAKMELCLTS